MVSAHVHGQKIMVVGACARGGFVPHVRQEAERQEGVKDKITQGSIPVTYFLQLDPTSKSIQNLQK
jgi:hypothetical protein